MTGGTFKSGIYSGTAMTRAGSCSLVKAHAGRIGGVIDPEVITVHTTDTMPGTTQAVVKSWSTSPGNGACAHFLIDRAGVLTQMMSIYRNGNHAGGAPHHGWFVAPQARQPDSRGLQQIHPNTIAVGIEVENAGYLGRAAVGGVWRHPDTKQVIPYLDVSVDSTGRGWHKPTDVQLAALGDLLRALHVTLRPARPGLVIAPNGTYKDNGVPWADVGAGVRVHAHASLDPTQKTDCGPFILRFARAEIERHTETSAHE